MQFKQLFVTAVCVLLQLKQKLSQSHDSPALNERIFIIHDVQPKSGAKFQIALKHFFVFRL